MASRINDVHIDKALTGFAVALPVEQGMLADALVPSIPVNKETDIYYIYKREELKLHDTYRAPGAESNELEFSYDQSTFIVDEQAIKHMVIDREVENQDFGLDLEFDGAQKCLFALRLRRERDIQSKVQTYTNWAGNATVSTKWDAAGADPMGDVHAAKQAFALQFGRLPNVAVINELVADALVRWLTIDNGISTVARIGGAASYNLDQFRSIQLGTDLSGEDPRLAGLFGIQRWLVGKQLYDSAAPGDTMSLARIWGSHCTLLFIAPVAGRKSPSAMYNFRRHGVSVSRIPVPLRKGRFIEVSEMYADKITSASAGYMIRSVLT